MNIPTSNYQAILLVAGPGERLRPETYQTAKCLLEIGDGKTILDIQLQALQDAGLKEVTLIIGHYGYKIRDRNKGYFGELDLRFIYNPFYAVTGGAWSLWLAKKVFKGQPSLIMDGDHVLSGELIKKLMDSPYKNCILYDPKKKDLDEDTQVVGQKGLVKYLAWSVDGQLAKHVNAEDCKGEALIIVKLCPKASSILEDELDRHLKRGASPMLEVIEPLNNTFRRDDCQYIDTGDYPWIEVDFKVDLENARNIVYPEMKQEPAL